MSVNNILYSTRAILSFDGTYLCVKRSFDDSFRSGEWEFPGGKVDRVPQWDVEALREVNEEVLGDYTVEDLYLDAIIRDMAAGRKYTGRQIRYLIFFGRLVLNSSDAASNLKPSKEHESVKLLTMQELLSKKMTSTTRRIITDLM